MPQEKPKSHFILPSIGCGCQQPMTAMDFIVFGLISSEAVMVEGWEVGKERMEAEIDEGTRWAG
jgi:hypothetical protein